MKRSFAVHAPKCDAFPVALIVLVMLLASASQSFADRPVEAPGNADLSIGADVVLTEPDTVLLDGQRQVPNRGERIFKVQRLGNGYADVATDDGTVRGWVEVNHVVPLDKGIAYFSDKIAASPKDAQAYEGRARVWMEKEDWDHAVADFDAALRLEPGNAKTHHLRALALFHKEEFDKAIEGFSEAIRLDPQFALAYRDRGLAFDAERYLDRTYPAKAYSDLSTAVRLEPENPAWVLSRAKVYAKRGKYDLAMADFAWVVQRRPNDPAVYLRAARHFSWTCRPKRPSPTSRRRSRSIRPRRMP